jgi:hypothetical protein
VDFQLASLESENVAGLISRHVEEFHTNTWGVAYSQTGVACLKHEFAFRKLNIQGQPFNPK